MSAALLGLLVGLCPAFVLVAFLLAGRYPGERVIESLRRILERPGRRSRPAAALAGRAHPWRPAPRGAALISHGLAGRAPPLPAPGGRACPHRP